MGKEAKTNAMRMLEKKKIPYEAVTYECDEFIDGLPSAAMTGAPVDASFKTLVMQGKSRQYYVFVMPIALEVDKQGIMVFCIPVTMELDLKKAAKAVHEKSIEMLPLKDLTDLTGYVRGGCSPLGMKKQFPTVIHESAKEFDQIYVSGGRIGLSLKISPLQLAEVTGAKFEDIRLEGSGAETE
mgnify:CR=1 FL=1